MLLSLIGEKIVLWLSFLHTLLTLDDPLSLSSIIIPDVFIFFHTILDFSKAFDTVPHEHLLALVEHYGIRGPMLDRIWQFLTNRKQTVVISGEPSTSVYTDSESLKE